MEYYIQIEVHHTYLSLKLKYLFIDDVLKFESN